MSKELLNPSKLFSRQEVLARQSPLPRQPGVYAWFFKNVPPEVPSNDCVKWNDLLMLYVGISPKLPPISGSPSKQTLWNRVRYHYNGNAEGSTLRLTLGCLLSDELDIQLRRVGSGNRMTFTKNGEGKLSEWMEKNAFVSWVEHPEPWNLEHELIKTLSLPLNLQDNREHHFHAQLSAIRSAHKQRARELPVTEN